MLRPNSLSRRAGLCALATLWLAGGTGAAPGPAAAAARHGGGDLSPRLADLAAPSLRGKPPARQARALGLPAEGPGSLLRVGNRVLVEVRAAGAVAAAGGAVRAAGAEVVDVSRRHETVTAAAAPAELPALGRASGVASVTEVLEPLVFAGPCPSGELVSEGDQQLAAAAARTAHGVDGSGVTVGVLSDSYDDDATAPTHADEDVESGDLPGVGNPCGHSDPVVVLEELGAGPDGSDEGRAMAQIVHDLAPGASIAFATAFTGMTGFAENIERLAEPVGGGGAGADAIVDDVVYFEEPFFQEGPVGVAVANATAAGAVYFSSAGNNNLISGGRDIASWEAPAFRDFGACPAALVILSAEIEAEAGPGFGLRPEHCMDFHSGAPVDGTFEIVVSAGATLLVDLQWAEPWDGVDTDVDAFLFDSAGELLAGSIGDNVFGSQRPFELLGWDNETGQAQAVQLVLNRYSGESPRLKVALLQNGGGVTSTEYPESRGGDVVGPTVFGHNGAADAVSTGAIRYDTTTTPEKFSSRGPVTHRFGPVDAGGPADPLPAPEVLAKPDLLATDGGVNTFFGSFLGGAWRFFGTSAAAPHAAAVAALMLEADPGATPAEVRAALWAGTAPVGAFGSCAVGAGLLDAQAAIGALLAEAAAAPPACTPPESPPWPEEEGGGEEGGEEGGAPSPSVSEAEALVLAANPPAPRATPPAPSSALRTFLRHRPPKVRFTRHRRARVVFRFGSNEPGVVFVCRIDGGFPRVCGRRLVRRLRIGKHVLRVRARDAAGNVDRTPAVYRFRIKRRR